MSHYDKQREEHERQNRVLYKIKQNKGIQEELNDIAELLGQLKEGIEMLRGIILHENK